MKKKYVWIIAAWFLMVVFYLTDAHAILKGDVNDDQQVTMADVILSLQSSMAEGPPGTFVHIAADVNGDNRIGLTEALFGLEIIAGVRLHPDIDDDNDGYTENQGDCNDRSGSVYPGAVEICGDGIDQDCDDTDSTCVPETLYVFEDFNSGAGGFIWIDSYFTVDNDRFLFTGDGTGYVYLSPWNGGPNPSTDYYAEPGDSNYFDDFHVSVNAYWHGGSSDWPYGISFCQKKNARGGVDWISFWITKNGFYSIDMFVDGNYQPLVETKRSFLLFIDDRPNKLAVQKQDNLFRFFINDDEVEKGLVDNFSGGSVGVAATGPVLASFDDYTVTNPYQGELVIPSAGYVGKRNELIYQAMTSTYLWYDHVPAINFQDYESADALINDLKYDDLDRWSYVVTQKEFYDFFQQGEYIGLGIGLAFISLDEIALTYVYENSPAKVAGLKRGDIILEINGKTIFEILSRNIWDAVWGEDKEGVTVLLKIKTMEGDVFNHTLEKAVVNINAVVHHEIIQQNDVKIGYMVFNHFIGTAEAELNDVFSEFIAEDIRELVLDLRYNGGGLIYLAQLLASLIAGDFVDDEIFMNVVHNDQYQIWDYEYHFEKPSNVLNLNRLVVITQEGSCSASELLINSLKPFINVTTIGDSTCGKPVGMYGYDFLDLHISHIEFQITNADDAGSYFQGISPDCPAEDDLTRQFGDVEELSLKEALFYINNGMCSSEQAQRMALLKKDKPETEISIMQGFRREIGAF